MGGDFTFERAEEIFKRVFEDDDTDNFEGFKGFEGSGFKFNTNFGNGNNNNNNGGRF